MPKFLYLSPSFPPQSRVGALRPLKFCRHLPALGWQAVVLCDLHESDAIDVTLSEALPAEVTVVRDWSRTARRNEAAVARGELPRPTHDAGGKPIVRRPSGLKRMLPRALQNTYRSPSFWWPSPEWVPLGHHSIEIPHALKASRRLMREHTFDAIVVNADPHAALLVGAQLSRESGIPLVLDLRDPWSVCELRRGERPWLQRRMVDAMERSCVAQASAVILNTETTRRDYLAHYADQPAAKFHVIRNHGDAALIANGSFDRDPRYTALFLGNFRRYVEGDELLEALALLKARGIDETKFHLVVTGRVPAEARAYAEKLGVAAMLTEGAFVPYRQVGSFMETADLLVALNNRTVQRVPAKVYDYLVSPRPMLVVADNPELGEMLAPLPYAELRSLDDITGIADAMAEAFALGIGFAVDRTEAGYDSATASAKLAAILSSVRRPQ